MGTLRGLVQRTGKWPRSGNFGWAVLLVLIPVCALANPQEAQGQRRDAFAAEVDRQLALEPPARYGEALRRLYVTNSYQPLWTHDARLTRQAHDVIAFISECATRGLDPTDYGLDTLRGDADALDREDGHERADTARLARVDVAVSRALLHLLSDLDRGRVDPARLGFELPESHAARDLAAVALRVSSSPDVPNVIASVEPPYAGYAALLRLLARYRVLAADSSLSLPPVDETVRPGDPYDDAPRLRRLLQALGDLAPTALYTTEPARYAGALVLAVMAFQRRHGLDPDGALGPATKAALRTPFTRRIRQIELALERWRWLPDRAPDRYIVVNVPAFRLYAFENDSAADRPSLSMNVVVGEAEGQHDTPVFVGEMREVVFRPYWDVPLRIARTELVPAIKRGAIDIDEEGYEIVSLGDTPRVYPSTRANLDRVALGALRLRQRPGDGNALGLVKFVFPNNHNVYVHGTPAAKLFAFARRDFSHGCIRAEQPVALALFALSGDTAWNRAAIEDAMHGKQTLHVPLAQPVSVFVLYMTTVVAPDGTLYFYPDLYGQDGKLARALGAR